MSASESRPARANDRTIPVTCTTHSSGRGFCNLRVTKVDDDIVLDPHVAGCYVITLDEADTTALFDLLGEWLG
ncbi:MAG: hypothetical protein ACRDUV_05930 [Pseudonocardiaceae bacterium]